MLYPCKFGSSKGGLNIGTALPASGNTFTFNTEVGKHFAVSSFTPVAFTGATVLTENVESVAGTVTYFSRLYIIEATASQVTMTRSGGATASPRVYCSLD